MRVGLVIGLALLCLVNANPFLEHMNNNNNNDDNDDVLLQEGVRFMSGEHKLIGDSVFASVYKRTGLKSSGNQMTLQMENNVTVSYGDVVALAADLYGISDKPIAFGKTHTLRRVRFGLALDSLMRDKEANGPKREVPLLKREFAREVQIINNAASRGVTPLAGYEKIADFLDQNFARITAGKPPLTNPSQSSTTNFMMDVVVKDSRYMDLAAANFDHFGQIAYNAYLVGHGVAMDWARQAKANSQRDPVRAKQMLNKAYVANAFADHYLTDLFSAGHVRTPRKMLKSACDTSENLGGVLAKCMHDEDNRAGLHVFNQRGDKWKLFGDKMLFSPESKRTLKIAKEAVKLSILGVAEAYRTGVVPKVNAWGCLKLIPKLDPKAANHPPLFKFDNKGTFLMRDSHINQRPEAYSKVRLCATAANTCRGNVGKCLRYLGKLYVQGKGDCKRTSTLTCATSSTCVPAATGCDGACKCAKNGFVNACRCLKQVEESRCRVIENA